MTTCLSPPAAKAKFPSNGAAQVNQASGPVPPHGSVRADLPARTPSASGNPRPVPRSRARHGVAGSLATRSPPAPPELKLVRPPADVKPPCDMSEPAAPPEAAGMTGPSPGIEVRLPHATRMTTTP